jgi:tetratricopeptide (TPR) repeat protein
LSENRISLQAARQAYWQGRLDDAVQIYQTLVKQAPGDPNALGELGNVYWQQGKQDAAFEVYFAAAHQLYLQKKQQQAWDLLTFVSLAQWLQQGSAGELLCQNIKKQ